ncbi:hypothetical protein D3C86_1408220 [compost metagenome]
MLQILRADLGRTREDVQGGGGLALRPSDGCHSIRDNLHLTGSHAQRVARLDERQVVRLGLLRSLVDSEAQARHCTGRQRHRRDKPPDVGSHRSRCWPDAAKHILELPTLLEHYGHRTLPALERRDDVGELRRHSPHSCRSGLCRHAQLLHDWFGGG